MNFSNKTALITGSGRGIGKATALHLAKLGADIVINYLRKQSAAEETAKEIEALGRRVLVIKADVSDEDDLNRLFEATDKAFGGLDILINNAASGYIRPIMEQKVKGWDWTMNINARAALFAAQKAVPLMQKRGGGAIVNISSIGNLRTLPDYVVIGASKGALEAVTRYCAVEFSPMRTRDEVRVAGGLRQAFREGGDQLVAGSVAERVVDELEVVHVERDHSHAFAGALCPPQP